MNTHSEFVKFPSVLVFKAFYFTLCELEWLWHVTRRLHFFCKNIMYFWTNLGDVWSHSRNFNECPSTQFTWASSAGLVVSSIVRYSDKKLYSYHVVGPLHKHYMYLMFLTGQCCEVLLNDCLVGGDGPCTLQHKGVKILVGARWKHFTGTNLPHFLNPRCRDPYEV